MSLLEMSLWDPPTWQSVATCTLVSSPTLKSEYIFYIRTISLVPDSIWHIQSIGPILKHRTSKYTAVVTPFIINLENLNRGRYTCNEGLLLCFILD